MPQPLALCRPFLRSLWFCLGLSGPALAQDSFEWVAEPAYQDAGSAHHGIVPLKQGDVWGLMNRQGDWMAEPQFEAVGSPGNGWFPVRLNGKWGILSETGEVIAGFDYDEIGTPSTYTPMKFQGVWYALGPTLQFDETPLPLDNLIGNDGTCMVGSKDGVIVVANRGDTPLDQVYPEIEAIGAPYGGRAGFSVAGKAGFLDCAHGTITGGEAIHDDVRRYAEDLAAVRRGEGWGYVGIYDNVLELGGSYQNARDFAEGLAPVQVEGKWGYIDRSGAFVIAPQFDNAYPFSDGVAGVEVAGKRGAILPDGRYAATPQFDDFWRHDGGVMPVKTGALWGVIAPDASDPATRLNLPLEALSAAMAGRDPGYSLQPSNPHSYFFQDVASVHSVHVTPDSTVMVTTLALQSAAEVALWDFASQRLIRKFPIAEATQALLLPGREIVAVGLSTGHLLLIDAVTGAELHRIRPHQGAVLDMVLSPDGKWLATTDGASLQSWDATSGTAGFSLVAEAEKLRFTADSTGLFAGNIRGGVTRLGLDGAILAEQPDGPPREDITGPFPQALSAMALTPDGVLVNLVTGSVEGSDGYFTQVSSLHITDAGGSRSMDVTEGIGDILTLDVSADGRLVAYAGSRMDDWIAVMEVRDLATGAVVYSQVLDQNPETEKIGLNRSLYSVDRLAFAPDGKLIVVGGEGQDILMFDPVEGRVTGSFGERLAAGQNGNANFDGTNFFVTDGAGQVWVWDLAEGRLAAQVPTGGGGHGPEEGVFSDGRRLYIYSQMDEGLMQGFDMETLQAVELTPEEQSMAHEKMYTSDPPAYPPEVQDQLMELESGPYGTVLDNGRLVVGSQPVGLHQVRDLATGTLLAQFLATPDGEWLIVTPEGFFAASANGARLVSVSNGLHAFAVDQAYQALYRPDLVRAKLSGDPDGQVARAASELDLARIMGSGPAPLTRFSLPMEGAKAAEPEIEVEIELQDEGGGIGRVEWRLNGVTVEVQPTREAVALDEAAPKATARVALDPGENVIEVVAYNAAGLLASAPRQLTVTWDGVASSAPPALHVLAVGVNDYADGRLKLNYAAADALAFAEAMKKAGAGLFSEVDVVTLLDQDVTEAKLDAAFTAMGEKARSQDVFLFFLAGHGKTIEGKYYFIPQDFRFEGDDPIRTHGIGQDRWQEWAAGIRAKKSVMIYDTCESGSLTETRSVDAAMAQSAAVARLTRAMGRTILSASTDDAPALEGYQGHGVMTWAMLDAFANADANGNATIEVTELASFLDVKVPEISAAAFGFRQVPQMSIRGSDFALGSRVSVLAASADSFPSTLTHVVAGGTDVLDGPGGAAVLVIDGGGFTGVYRIEEKDGFARIAREGKALGWVAADTLTPLQ